MSRLQIGTQVIDFPNTGTDAIWSGTVIQFAEAVQSVLAGLASPYDVSQRVLSLDINGTTYTIPAMVFPTQFVRSFKMNYAGYLESNTNTIAVTGDVKAVQAAGVWTLEHSFVGPVTSGNQPYFDFIMSGDQLQVTTVNISGSYNSANSKFSYSAITQLVDNI